MRNKKTLVILPGSTLSAVQEDFAAHYPFLAIECCGDDALHGILGDPADKAPGTNRPRFARSVGISGERTVAEVVLDLRNALEMEVRLSRKSGKVWNVITLTDSWTLDRQNTAGAYISELMSEARPKSDH